jgi:hypothetical protein
MEVPKKIWKICDGVEMANLPDYLNKLQSDPQGYNIVQILQTMQMVQPKTNLALSGRPTGPVPIMYYFPVVYYFE